MSSHNSNTLKWLAKKFIGLYLLPLRSSTKVFHQVKGIFFLDPSEHLYRAAKHIALKTKVNDLHSSIMIDVGAAFGSVASYFSNLYPELKIYCVEPNPAMLPRLEVTLEGRPNIVVRNVALSGSKGELYLHVTANELSSSLNELDKEQISKLGDAHQSWLEEVEKVKVNVSTLDSEFSDVPHVLLLKLDTQGTELEILKGGSELLKRTRFVLTEMNNHHLYKEACQYYEVDEFLRSHSFRLVDLTVSYHTDEEVQEYDALYENTKLQQPAK